MGGEDLFSSPTKFTVLSLGISQRSGQFKFLLHPRFYKGGAEDFQASEERIFAYNQAEQH